MQNIEQQRANYALQEVKRVLLKLTDKDEQKEFKSYVTSMPAMIQMNGLGQAVAFYRSKFKEGGKGASAYKELYTIIEQWLCSAEYPASVYDEYDLLQGITKNDMQQYRIAQSELQKLLVWMKKMVAAFIDSEE